MILLGLGSNVGDREENLKQALQALAADPNIRVVQISDIYETAPYGVEEQADFLNMAALIETGMEPEALLKKCLAVEQSLGRVRTLRWGPRTIDIDLLFFDQVKMETEQLILPHPGIASREFVLVPLRDLAPDLIISSGLSVRHLAGEFSRTGKNNVRLWRKVHWDSDSKAFS